MNIKKLFKSKEIGIFLVLCLLFVIFSILSPQFLKMKNIFNITKQIATLGICSIGFSFVLITGGIDLSLGYQISLSNIVCAVLIIKYDVNWMFAIFLVIIMGILIGLLNGIIITQTGVAPLIVTLSMMTILNGVSYLISKGLPIFGFPQRFAFLGQGSIGPIPVSLVILLLLVAVGWFILNKTYFGRYIFAIGSNEEAAQLSGVNTKKIRMLVYSLCGFFTSIGAVLMLSRLNSAQSATGAGFEFDVLTACVLGGVSSNGGKGSMLGAIIGVLIVGVLDNGLLLLGVSEYLKLVIKGCILLVAVVYDTMSRARSERIKKVKSVNADNA